MPGAVSALCCPAPPAHDNRATSAGGWVGRLALPHLTNIVYVCVCVQIISYKYPNLTSLGESLVEKCSEEKIHFRYNQRNVVY